MTIRTIRPMYITVRDLKRYREERRRQWVAALGKAAAFLLAVALLLVVVAVSQGCGVEKTTDELRAPMACDKTDPRFSRLILNNAVCAGAPTTYAPIPSGTCANTVGAPLVGCTVTDNAGRALWVCVEACPVLTDGGGQ